MKKVKIFISYSRHRAGLCSEEVFRRKSPQTDIGAAAPTNWGDT